jgi:anti-sigma factor (TIGR02949 family)
MGQPDQRHEEGVRMECAEVVERLWEYLDGELAAKEAAAVGRHLAGCPHCRPHYRCDRAFLVLVVRSLTRPCPTPQGLKATILARLSSR